MCACLSIIFSLLFFKNFFVPYADNTVLLYYITIDTGSLNYKDVTVLLCLGEILILSAV